MWTQFRPQKHTLAYCYWCNAMVAIEDYTRCQCGAVGVVMPSLCRADMLTAFDLTMLADHRRCLQEGKTP